MLALIWRDPILGCVEHGVLIPGSGRTVAVPGFAISNCKGNVQGQLVPDAATCRGEVSSRVEGSEDCIVDVGAVVPSREEGRKGAVCDPEDGHSEDDH